MYQENVLHSDIWNESLNFDRHFDVRVLLSTQETLMTDKMMLECHNEFLIRYRMYFDSFRERETKRRRLGSWKMSWKLSSRWIKSQEVVKSIRLDLSWEWILVRSWFRKKKEESFLNVGVLGIAFSKRPLFRRRKPNSLLKTLNHKIVSTYKQKSNSTFFKGN